MNSKIDCKFVVCMIVSLVFALTSVQDVRAIDEPDDTGSDSETARFQRESSKPESPQEESGGVTHDVTTQTFFQSLGMERNLKAPCCLLVLIL